MIQSAQELIDALGGTTAVATLTKNRVTTVHSWRANGIPEARLDHIILAAEKAGIEVPSYHAAGVMCGSNVASPGNVEKITGPTSYVVGNQPAEIILPTTGCALSPKSFQRG